MVAVPCPLVMIPLAGTLHSTQLALAGNELQVGRCLSGQACTWVAVMVPAAAGFQVGQYRQGSDCACSTIAVSPYCYIATGECIAITYYDHGVVYSGTLWMICKRAPAGAVQGIRGCIGNFPDGITAKRTCWNCGRWHEDACVGGTLDQTRVQTECCS